MGPLPALLAAARAGRPVEILAHRIVWSLSSLPSLLALDRSGFGGVARRSADRRARLLALAAVLITVNWGTYIYGVNTGHVVETWLGYFINPLVTVAARRRRARRAAAARAVGRGRHRRRSPSSCSRSTTAGRRGSRSCSPSAPGLYGLIEEAARASTGCSQPRGFESALFAPPALAYLLWIVADRRGHVFTSDGAGHAALLASTGVVTAVPLMLFGAAAIRVRPSTLGLLQYLAPILQLAIGVFVDGEAMPLSRLAGFALVWVALIVFTTDALRGGRERPLVRASGPGEQGEHGRRATEQEGDDHIVEDIDHGSTVARVP